MTLRQLRKLLIGMTITALIITACTGAETSPTPTEVSIEAIYTVAAATVFAQQTGTANAQPRQTITPTSTITATGTITPTPAPTRAVFVPVIPAATLALVITTTGTPGTLVPSATATFGGVGCNNSAFIQDVTIPNNTKLNPGESFTKTWRIKNTGSGACTWNTNYKFTFIGGSLFGSDTTKIRKTIPPGATMDFSLNMVAPTVPGTYTSNWRLASDDGTLFGSGFNVVIIIPGATATPTSASAATATATTAAAATQTMDVPATQTALAATQAAIAATQTSAAATQAAAAATASQAAADASATAAAAPRASQ
ncbi:MAG: NBR1-Ig-like domain-containing protein [Chloroflexi bacterium]|nr:NBR1-Ig-like domain-containing protein [Chloroflexota bacterium]